MMSSSTILLITASMTLAVVGQGPLDCSGKGSLSDRFMANLRVNDANNDGVADGMEFYNDFLNNYDVDKDGCCSVSEWVQRWDVAFNFSAEYAMKRMEDIGGKMNDSCPILYTPYKSSPVTVPDADFLSNNIQSLVDLCDLQSDLVNTNCDCAQLSNSCRFDPRMQQSDACKKYTATYIYGKSCNGKGLLGGRFAKNLEANDANGDGFITGAEVFNDLKDNYDVNKDGCVSVQEWVDRFTSYYGFSDGYARQRLSDIVPDMSAKCTVQEDTYLAGHINIPQGPFLQGNIQSLVEFCKTASPDVRGDNCDCLQLLDACKWNPLMGANVVCQSYLAAPVF